MKPDFTHCYINGHWFVNWVYKESDFVELEQLGENEIDGVIFIATDKKGEKHILKNNQL